MLHTTYLSAGSRPALLFLSKELRHNHLLHGMSDIPKESAWPSEYMTIMILPRSPEGAALHPGRIARAWRLFAPGVVDPFGHTS
jgi:hypothetical protein